MTITEALKEYHSADLDRVDQILKERRINLGTANGWGPKEDALAAKLRKFEIAGASQTIQLGRCYREERSSISDGEHELLMIYRVDSSD